MLTERISPIDGRFQDGPKVLDLPRILVDWDSAVTLMSPAGWVVRDVKLNRQLDGHPQIASQLNFYGLLVELSTGRPPARLEVLLGNGQVQAVPYLGKKAVRAEVRDLVRLCTGGETYEPVGWSKCGGCPYRDHCWRQAEERQDVSLLPDVDQGLARRLHELGCRTIADLERQFDVQELAQLKRPVGNRRQKVGAGGAARILAQARSWQSGEHVFLDRPELPRARHVAMFDLEGLPPLNGTPESVFLWGVKVYGPKPSGFRYVDASACRDDRQAWFRFLGLIDQLFSTYGDIPFVHWASYEQTKLRLYLNRYGDRRGTAERLSRRLFDLLPVFRASVVLPLASYSLKQVEKYVGFERRLPGGGDWAIVQYLRSSAESKNRRVPPEVLAYNEEDLDATNAVWSWLVGQLS